MNVPMVTEVEGKMSDKPSGIKICSIYLGGMFVILGLAFFVALKAPGYQKCTDATPRQQPPVEDKSEIANKTLPPLSLGGYAIAGVLGESRTETLHAATLSITAFFCVILCTVTAAVVVTFMPEKTEADFEVKGTLSNVCQNIATPHGRIFAVMLFTGGLLSLTSGYTLHIYPSWFPKSDKVSFFFPNFQRRQERVWRMCWIAIPNIGLMFTSLLPSLSNNDGTNIALTLIHNIAAPCSLAFAVIMETVQLDYGEDAFSYFFCGVENATWYGPLNFYQRVRAIILVYTWVSALTFLSIQVYLGVGAVLGLKISTSYSLALTSFYFEITSLMLAYGLPAIQATAILKHLWWASVLEEAQVIESVTTPKATSSLLETIAQPLKNATVAVLHNGQLRRGFHLGV